MEDDRGHNGAASDINDILKSFPGPLSPIDFPLLFHIFYVWWQAISLRSTYCLVNYRDGIYLYHVILLLTHVE